MKKLCKKVLSFLLFLSCQFDIIASPNYDLDEIKKTVFQWSEAHNNNKYGEFEALYSDHLLFYGQELSKSKCLELKRKALAADPNFSQSIISEIQIALFESGTIKCLFTKEVHSKKGNKSYPSYLLLVEKDGMYSITGESDEITDSNLNYNLKLGNQIAMPNASKSVFSTYKDYIEIGIIIILITILLFKLKSKSSEHVPDAVETDNHRLEKVDSFEPLGEETKFNSQEAADKAKQAIADTISQTRTFVTKLLNLADGLDRMLYGRRMKAFIMGTFIVLGIAPFLDYLLKLDDMLTFISTLVFLIFLIVLVLAFVGSWRDDNGNVTWSRTKSRLNTYLEILNHSVAKTKSTSQVETLYTFGRFLFFAGFGLKALGNVSLLIRKTVWTCFDAKMNGLIKFEKLTNDWFWLPIVIGLSIIFYLYKQNAKIFERVKLELIQFIGTGQGINSKYASEKITLVSNQNMQLVVNAKEEEHLSTLGALSNSRLFNDFALALKQWKPKRGYYEYQFQDSLLVHLRDNLTDASIESEKPIVKLSGRNGRADIVINDTILIEMKRDSSASGVQRAIGQVVEYSKVWQNKGPVILLLCDYNYEHARAVYSSAMEDQFKLGRPVITIVAKTK